MKGQIVADFIVEHRIDTNQGADLNLVSTMSWRLYFDGSVCNNNQGVNVVHISPYRQCIEDYCLIDYFCINDQDEYEALWFELELLVDAGDSYRGVQ